MSDLLGPDGGRIKNKAVSIKIHEVDLPLPDVMESADAALFQQRFCIGEQQVPGVGTVRAPMMTGPSLLVAIEVANALKERDEKIEAMEKVVDDLHAQLEGLAMRLSEIEAEGNEA